VSSERKEINYLSKEIKKNKENKEKNELIDITEERLEYFENRENYFYRVQNNFSDKNKVIYKYDKEELSKQSKESDEITDSMESKKSLSLKTDDFE